MIDDERLMAFADDMLDEEERRSIEAAIAADPALAARVTRMQRVTAELRGAFADQLDLEVPQRLRALIEPKAAGNVVRFPRRMPRQVGVGLAAAACLGLAFIAGRATSPDLMRVDPSRGLVAQGALQQALDARPSGRGANGIEIVLSFADKPGGHCRVFELEASAGLACGERGDWRIVVLTELVRSRGGGDVAQAAGAIPDTILEAADERRAGDPLDAAAERVAIEARWRKAP